jgi:hypothetical protein
LGIDVGVGGGLKFERSGLCVVYRDDSLSALKVDGTCWRHRLHCSIRFYGYAAQLKCKPFPTPLAAADPKLTQNGSRPRDHRHAVSLDVNCGADRFPPSRNGAVPMALVDEGVSGSASSHHRHAEQVNVSRIDQQYPLLAADGEAKGKQLVGWRGWWWRRRGVELRRRDRPGRVCGLTRTRCRHLCARPKDSSDPRKLQKVPTPASFNSIQIQSSVKRVESIPSSHPSSSSRDHQ